MVKKIWYLAKCMRVVTPVLEGLIDDTMMIVSKLVKFLLRKNIGWTWSVVLNLYWLWWAVKSK